MEYTRRKRKRGRARSGGGGGAGKVIVALLVAGAIIYLISASAAGTWIAENVMAPLFSTFQGIGGEADATPTSSLSLVNNDAPSGQQATEEIELPAMACFALQMGAYSSRENANAQAADLQKQGAGGFVLQDGDKYRVLAAAYEDETSLKQVREQLKEEGLDCASYTMNTPSNVLKVTASEGKIQSMKQAFFQLAELQKKLANAVIAFDKEKQTPEEGRLIIKTMYEDLEEAYNAFVADIIPGENVILDSVKDCFMDTIQALQDLMNNTTESMVDFSSKMKYTHLYIANAYYELGLEVSATY